VRPRFVEWLTPWLAGFASWAVPGYVFMLALGALVGAVLAVDSGRREGFAKQETIATLMVAYATGLAGACAVPFAQACLVWANGGRLAAPTGMAAYGGLSFGVVGGVAYLRVKGRPAADVWRFLDVVAPTLALGIFFARIGCFLAGCDYGAPTRSAVGTTFPAHSHAFRDQIARGLLDSRATESLPVHPTQLYEAASGLALFFALRAMNQARVGTRFVALVLGYAMLRSVIEVFRGDASRGHVGALSIAQVFALVTSFVVLLLFVREQERRTA
jgi:prolipoprotein diacylglyceryltransferase